MATWAGDGQTPVRIFISDGTNWLEANAAISDGVQWSGLTPYVNPTASYLYSEAIFSITSNLTQKVYFTQSDANGVTVDWGDGSPMETYAELSVAASHTYAEAGDYVVRFIAGAGVTWSPGATIQSVNGNNETITTVYGFLGTFSISGGKTISWSSYPTLTSFRFGKGATLNRSKSFAGASSLREVILPSDVSSIPSYAFAGCTNLKSVSFSNPILSVDDYAFYQCQYYDVSTIINDLSSIGNYAFSHCSGESSYLELKASSIGYGAFEYCSGLRRVWLRNVVQNLLVRTNSSNGSVTDYIGPFYQCDGALILYAECYEIDKPSGWQDHFNAQSGTDNVFLVIWHQTVQPSVSLKMIWNAHGRLFSFIDEDGLGEGYEYDTNEQKLTIY